MPAASHSPTGAQARITRNRISFALTIVAVVAVGVGVALRLVLLKGGQLGYDEGVYWQSLRSMDDGHPLFAATFSSQPPAFLDYAYAVWSHLGRSLVAARLAVMATAVVGVLGVIWLASRLAGVRAALVAVTILALDPLAIRASVMLEADLASTAWGIVAVACTVESRRRGGRAGILLAFAAGVVLALAVLTKLFAVAFVPAILGAVLIPRFQATAAGATRQRLKLLVAGVVGGGVATVVILVPHAGQASAMWQQVVASHLTARDLVLGGFTADTLAGLRGEAAAALLSLVAVVVLVLRRDRGTAGFLVLLLGAPPVLLLMQKPLWAHHLVLLTPGLAVAAGVGVALLLARFSFRWASGAVLAVVVGTVAAGWVAVVTLNARPVDAATPGQLRALVAPATVVASDNQFIAAAADLDVPPDLVDTSAVRIGVGDLTTRRAKRAVVRSHAGAVIFSTGKFDQLPGFRRWVARKFPDRTRLNSITVFHR